MRFEGRISIALALHFLKHPVHHTNVEVDVFIEAGAESVNEGDGTDVQACLVHMGRTGAVGLQSLCDHPQKDAQHHAQHRSVALHEVPQPLGHGEHPLAHRQAGKTWSLRCAAVSTMRRVVHEGQTPRPLQEKATK
jgi:hypothetical protein